MNTADQQFRHGKLWMLKRLYTDQTKKIIRQYHKTSPIHKMLLFYSCKQQFHLFCSVYFIAWDSFMGLYTFKSSFFKDFFPSPLSFENTIAHNGVICLQSKKSLLYKCEVSEQKKMYFLFNIRHYFDVCNIIMILVF